LYGEVQRDVTLADPTFTAGDCQAARSGRRRSAVLPSLRLGVSLHQSSQDCGLIAHGERLSVTRR